MILLAKAHHKTVLLLLSLIGTKTCVNHNVKYILSFEVALLELTLLLDLDYVAVVTYTRAEITQVRKKTVQCKL